PVDVLILAIEKIDDPTVQVEAARETDRAAERRYRATGVGDDFGNPVRFEIAHRATLVEKEGARSPVGRPAELERSALTRPPDECVSDVVVSEAGVRQSVDTLNLGVEPGPRRACRQRLGHAHCGAQLET